MGDMVKRLRYYSKNASDVYMLEADYIHETLGGAADEIEHQQEIITRAASLRLDLEAENKRLRKIEEAAKYLVQKEGMPVFLIALEDLDKALAKQED